MFTIIKILEFFLPLILSSVVCSLILYLKAIYNSYLQRCYFSSTHLHINVSFSSFHFSVFLSFSHFCFISLGTHLVEKRVLIQINKLRTTNFFGELFTFYIHILNVNLPPGCCFPVLDTGLDNMRIIP